MFYVLEKYGKVAFQGVTLIFIARYFSQEQLGYYAFAISVASFLSIVASLGFDPIVFRFSAVYPRASQRILVQAMTLAGVLSIILMFSMLWASSVSVNSFEAFALLLFSLMIPGAIGNLGQTYLLATRKFALSSQVCLMIGCVGSIAKISICLMDLGANAIVVSHAIEVTAITCVLMFEAARRLDVAYLRLFPLRIYARLIGSSWPIALHVIGAFFYMRMDQFALRILADPAAVGLYSLALKLFETLMLLITVLVRAFTARLIQNLRNDPDGFESEVEIIVGSAFFGSVFLSLALFAFGGNLFEFVFGDGFGEAGVVASILVLAVVPLVVGQIAMLVAVQKGAQWAPVARTVIGISVNAAGNWMLIPSMGVVGAAITTLASFWVSGVLTLVLNRDERQVLRPVLIGLTGLRLATLVIRKVN